MLIVVVLSRWSNDMVCFVVNDGYLHYWVLDTVVISGKYVHCNVVFGTLVCVSVFSVIWYELLMTSDIICPLWSLVYDCQRVECAFTSPVRIECGMFVMYLCSVVCPCQLFCCA